MNLGHALPQLFLHNYCWIPGLRNGINLNLINIILLKV